MIPNYDGIKDTVVPNEHSVIPEFINSLRLYEKRSFTEICMKDSRAINQEDRNEILKAIEEERASLLLTVLLI